MFDNILMNSVETKLFRQKLLTWQLPPEYSSLTEGHMSPGTEGWPRCVLSRNQIIQVFKMKSEYFCPSRISLELAYFKSTLYQLQFNLLCQPRLRRWLARNKRLLSPTTHDCKFFIGNYCLSEKEVFRKLPKCHRSKKQTGQVLAYSLVPSAGIRYHPKLHVGAGWKYCHL